MSLALAGLADGRAAGLGALARILAPRKLLGIPEWADAYRWIGKPAAEPGPWRTDRIPFLRGVMNALDRRDPAPIVVLVKSSQVGGTEAGLCWVGRSMQLQPTSFLAIFPTDKVGRKWVRTKLRRMTGATPALRAILGQSRRSKQTSTVLELHFGDGGLFLVGSANNPDDLSSTDAENLFLDEVDRMPAILEGEGDPIELALMRSSTYPRRKAFFVSTPTTEDASHIWPYWLQSTQDRFFVPCPGCGEFQSLSFDNLTWPDGKPKLAVYRCSYCENEIPENKKTEMLAGGEWRPTHPERADSIRGFHINGLYTPIGLGDSWAKHAAAWERARGNAGRTQAYFNTRRGEPIKTGKIKVNWETIAARREPFQLRTVPKGALVLTAFADVQKDRIETEILGFGRDGRCWIVDYTVLEGDPTRFGPSSDGTPSVWKKLDDYLAGELVNSCGIPMRIACALVDAGNWQQEVIAFTRHLRARHIFASKGSSIPGRQPIGRPTMIDVKSSGKIEKRGAELYLLGVSVLKTALYQRLAADEETLPADRLLHFSSDLPDEWFRQLCAEEKTPAGKWEKRYDRNEVLDLTVGAMAAAMHHSLQVHRYRAPDWARLEELYEPATPPEGAKPPAPPGAPGSFFPTPAVAS